jgi:DNA primase
MTIRADEVKRIPLVEFLERAYGMEFRLVGGEYRALSPFTDETDPSFFVRQAEDGHWLFKDFSSGAGGSIIDFVQIKEELAHDIPAVLDRIEQLWGGLESPSCPRRASRSGQPGPAEQRRSVDEILELIRKNDLEPVKAYLRSRGIAEEVIEELEGRGILGHNVYKGRNYATFVARDPAGKNRCLANEDIEDRSKFVYGKKYPFCLNPKAVKEAEQVYVTEGVVDLLSLKTIVGKDFAGLALLGNDPKVVDPALVEKARVVQAALDADDAGLMGTLDFPAAFPGKEIRTLAFDEAKDPNELLLQLRNKREAIPADAKAWLYAQAKVQKNKSEVARRWGVDRSWLYDLIREGDAALQERFTRSRRGRPPAGKPRTLEQALAVIEALQEEKQDLQIRYEEEHVRASFTGLRLKWAEEALEEHGIGKPDGTKEQLKKNRKSK